MTALESIVVQASRTPPGAPVYMTQTPELMTTAEVADAVRAPVETVRFWRHVGKRPKSFKLGRRVLYDREDVLAFIAAARDKPA